MTPEEIEAIIARQRFKSSARSKLGRAVRLGGIAKPATCEKCGSDKYIEAHHPDYGKPLDVRWLCRVCHRALHWAEWRINPIHPNMRATLERRLQENGQ
jgi:transposase-like protein